MRDMDSLRQCLERIDGRGYGAYKDLKGTWDLGRALLFVDHVQGDPFAAPSRVRLRWRLALPDGARVDRDSREAAEDWLLRRFDAGLSPRKRGSGKSGQIEIYRPGPQVVERSALRLVGEHEVEARLRVGLPARGRRIRGRQAWALLTEDLVETALALHVDPTLDDHIRSIRVQRGLRRQLAGRRLVAFLADGSVLPRRSGVDARPLDGAVALRAPDALAVTLDTPDGPIRGLGLSEGVTVLVGGGFHGKSTVLQAIQRGHLDHVPGDGRERVVTRADAVKVRAEDGRRVTGVDISPFLGTLPGGRATAPFDTDDASGSTSQAAALVEAMEAGAGVLLLDEDTSATNLLVRDARMRALIPAEHEPITPLVERVRQLYDTHGVSTILVVGGVADYLAAADTVVLMAAFHPRDATTEARALLPDPPAPPGRLPPRSDRVPRREGLAPGRWKARSARRITYAGHDLDLAAIETVLDRSHAATLGEALRFLHDHLVDDQRTVPQILDALEAILDDEGVEALSPWPTPTGTLIRPRRHEVAAALNRLRTLRVVGS